MKLTDEDLLPNESVVLKKNANAVIGVTESGLTKFAFGKWMWVIGMKGKEAIGGKLYLTNYRLIFKSHRLNRLRGKFSIFLPTVTELEDTSFLMTRKVSIRTKWTKFDFVMWGISDFIKKAESERANLTEDKITELRKIAIENFDKCGEGLQVFGGLENINKVFLHKGKVSELIKLATNPFEGLAAMAYDELLDQAIVKPWQEKFE